MRNKSLKITKYSYIDKSLHVNELLKHQKPSSRKIFLLNIIFFMILGCACICINHFCKNTIEKIREKILQIGTIHDIKIIRHSGVPNTKLTGFLEKITPQFYKMDSLAEIKQAIEANAFVKRVQVSLKLPNTVVISIDERIPAALWLNAKTYNLIDDEGFIIQSNYPFSKEEKKYMIVIGKNANIKLKEFNASKHKIINGHVLAAEFVGNRRWDILLMDGRIVKMPENNWHEALETLSLLSQHYKNFQRFKIIDLRLTPDKVYCE